MFQKCPNSYSASLPRRKQATNQRGGRANENCLCPHFPSTATQQSCHPGFFTFFSTNIRLSTEILWQNRNTGSFFFQPNKANVKRERALPACGSSCDNVVSSCMPWLKQAARTHSFIHHSLKPTKGTRTCLGEVLHKGRAKVISYMSVLQHFLQEQRRTFPNFC